jgi:WD40 repeat protein
MGIKLVLGLRIPGQKESLIAYCDLASKTPILSLPGQVPALYSSALFSPSGNLLLACFTQVDSVIGRARLWNLGEVFKGTIAPRANASGAELNIAMPSELKHETAITTAAFHPNEKWLLTGSTDDNARLSPIANGRLAEGVVLCADGEAHTHTADVTRVLFSPDGKLAVTAAKDQTAVVWKLDGVAASGKPTAVLRHAAYVNNVDLTPRAT